MKSLLVMWMILIIFCPSSYGETTSFTNERIVEAIRNILPPDWKIVEETPDQIPYGHYWGLEYKGERGQKLVLQGPRDAIFRWRDHLNHVHDVAIAKESLDIWIMPPDYDLSWKRHFVIDKPISATLIASGEVAKVYGFQTHRILNKDQFNALVQQASQTSWPNSSEPLLSWMTWQKDLRHALSNVLEKP